MRALLIDDQQLIRESLEMLLQVMMPDISLDHAASAHGAIQLAATIDYQLILLDWWLGEVNGGQCIEQLRAAGSTAPVVVVSGDDNEQVVQQALALGGGRYLPPRRAAGPAAPIPGVPVRRELQEVFPDLTERQIEVFRVLIRGQSDKQIARELKIAESTVKTHVRAIFQALGAQRRSEAAYIARQRGASEC